MISIGEILKTECFREARLLTDADLNVRIIGSVTVGEVPDIAEWLTGGEMVLSALFTSRDAGGEKFETVKNIIRSPAGALVIKLGRFVESLPPHVIKLANRRRFPIISIPPEVRWTKVIADISRLLSHRELLRLTWLEAVRQQFGRAASGTAGLTHIVETLSNLINRRVTIEDLLGSRLAQSMEGNQHGRGHNEVSVSRLLGRKSSSYRIKKNLSPNSYSYHMIAPRRESSPDKLVFEVEDGRGHCGYLVIYVDSSEDIQLVDETEILVIEKAVEATNTELSRMRASIDAEIRLTGSLFALLSSGTLSRQEALRRASFLQIDLTPGFIVCVVDLILPSGGSDARAREQVVLRCLRIVKGIVSDQFPGSLVALDNEGMSIVLVPPSTIDPVRRRSLIRSVLERISQSLSEAVPKIGLRIGASSFHADVAAMNVGYEEATAAAIISAATDGTKEIGNFKDLGLYKLLLHINQSHPEEAHGFYIDTLGSIEEYDRKRGGGLIQTLEVFLDSSESVSSAAVKLFAHRHTVRYRLQRIAELSGLNPFDSDDREVLRVALKLRKLISSIRSQNALSGPKRKKNDGNPRS